MHLTYRPYALPPGYMAFFIGCGVRKICRRGMLFV